MRKIRVTVICFLTGGISGLVPFYSWNDGSGFWLLAGVFFAGSVAIGIVASPLESKSISLPRYIGAAALPSVGFPLAALTVVLALGLMQREKEFMGFQISIGEVVGPYAAAIMASLLLGVSMRILTGSWERRAFLAFAVAGCLIVSLQFVLSKRGVLSNCA